MLGITNTGTARWISTGPFRIIGSMVTTSQCHPTVRFQTERHAPTIFLARVRKPITDARRIDLAKESPRVVVS
jgi:hypothetical protein